LPYSMQTGWLPVHLCHSIPPQVNPYYSVAKKTMPIDMFRKLKRHSDHFEDCVGISPNRFQGIQHMLHEEYKKLDFHKREPGYISNGALMALMRNRLNLTLNFTSRIFDAENRLQVYRAVDKMHPLLEKVLGKEFPRGNSAKKRIGVLEAFERDYPDLKFLTEHVKSEPVRPRGSKPRDSVSLTEPLKQALRKLNNARARIILLASEGLRNTTIAKRLEIHPQTVIKWRKIWKEHTSVLVELESSIQGDSEAIHQAQILVESVGFILDVQNPKAAESKSYYRHPDNNPYMLDLHSYRELRFREMLTEHDRMEKDGAFNEEYPEG
jgi:hypothetical protein